MKNTKLFAYPYIIWISIMIVVPVFLVFLYSIGLSNDGNPISLKLTLTHYKDFFTRTNLLILYKSIKLALLTTIITLILGYPIAFIISKISNRYQNTLLLLFIMPMWINMLLRTYAWQVILSRNGLLNNFLNIDLLYTDFAVILGMIYNFIPFMVLPIYTALVKIDHNLVDAASDLGANKIHIFFKIIFPLSIPGIITGIVMVFLPSISSFTIPRLLGGASYFLIGNLIEQEFINIGDWNFGSAISMIIMFMILISIYAMKYFDKDNDSKGALPW